MDRYATFRTPLMRWFRKNRRDDPWRNNPTPYSAWIAEVMLQQTVLKTVIRYFDAWMANFPTVEALSSASERDVLRQWEGLGYYSRARNLHKAAKIISRDYGGQIPDNYEQLIRLPGIGKYTAAAILSIAFGGPTPVLDANVRRVMTRYLIQRKNQTVTDEKTLDFLDRSISRKSPGLFNEAVMELGQKICRPRHADHDACPLKANCGAARFGIPKTSSLGAKKTKSHKSIVVLAFDGKRILLEANPDGLFGGLYTLPRIDDSDKSATIRIKRFANTSGLNITKVPFPLTPRIHSYTTNAVQLSPFLVKVAEVSVRGSGKLKWVRLGDLSKYPLPSVYRRIIDEFLEINATR